jgi:TPR repeat protein
MSQACRSISAVFLFVSVCFLFDAWPVVSDGVVTPDTLAKIKSAAEQGDAKAQTRLGYKYHLGSGVAKDDFEAVRWWRKAADQNNSFAEVALAKAYYVGFGGLPKDFGESRRLYLLAASQGNPIGQVVTGALYHLGDGVPKDDIEAVKWWRKAAENQSLIALP